MKNKTLHKSMTNDWELVKLSDISKIYDGTHQTPNYVSAGVPFYSVEHVTSGNFRDTKFISEDVFKNESKRIRLEKHDILMTRIGDIGTTKYIDWNPKASFYVSLALIKCNKNINSKFVNYAINSSGFKDELRARTLTVAFPNKINLGDIGDCKLFIPPELEQSRIVSVMETWDTAIEKLAQKIDTKKEIRSGLMQDLLSGKKRLPRFTEKWAQKKLGELFSERNERGVANLPLLSITSDRGVIYQSDSNKKDTSNSDKSKYLHICPGDIGYNTMRMWQGRSALSKMEGLVSPAYTILKPNKDVDSRYFAYLFKTPRMVNYFFQKSQGLVSDTWQCRYKDFSIIHCAVPDYGEQKAIADVLETADKEITALEEKLSTIREQKRFLLNNLITGVIRTPETLSSNK